MLRILYRSLDDSGLTVAISKQLGASCNEKQTIDKYVPKAKGMMRSPFGATSRNFCLNLP